MPSDEHRNTSALPYQVWQQYLTCVVLWGHGLRDDLSEGFQPLPLLLIMLTHKHKLPVWSLQRDATVPPASPLAPAAVLWNGVAVARCADEHSTLLHSILTVTTNNTERRLKKSTTLINCKHYLLFHMRLISAFDPPPQIMQLV